MMNPTINAGQGEALPATPRHLDEVRTAVGTLQHNVGTRLMAVLRAAENLADCRRVLGAFEDHVDLMGEAADERFRAACASWCNPGADDGFELLQDLLRVAVELAREEGERLDRLESLVTAASAPPSAT